MSFLRIMFTDLPAEGGGEGKEAREFVARQAGGVYGGLVNAVCICKR